MSTPIKSSQIASTAQGGAASADLLARMGTPARVGEGQGPVMAFSSWMAQHGQGSEASQAPAAPKAPQAASRQDPEARNLAMSRAQEQTVQRARQQAMAAQKASTQSAESARMAEQAAARARADKSTPRSAASESRAEQVHEPEARDESAKDDERTTTDANAAGAQAQQAAPAAPSDGRADMMAWLANLAQGKADRVPSGADVLADDAAAADQARIQKDAVQGGRDADKAQPATQDARVGAQALDAQLWQSVHSTATLQVDAMLAGSGRAGEQKTGVDSLSSLMAGGALHAAGAGASIQDGAAGVRHESATLPVPLGSPTFAEALADQVSVWVSGARTDGPMTAELHLNPAEMGPINVKISLDGDSAQVDFAAAAVETRKAIEASLSQLSASLNEVGLNLTGGGVSAQTSQQSFGQQFAQADGARTASGGSGRIAGESGDRGEDISLRPVSMPRTGRPGGLDLYA